MWKFDVSPGVFCCTAYPFILTQGRIRLQHRIQAEAGGMPVQDGVSWKNPAIVGPLSPLPACPDPPRSKK
jgi:hypothetical protein